MLRQALFVIGTVVLVVGGLIGIVGYLPLALHLVFWGALLLVALQFERWRYRDRNDGGQNGWQTTAERFEDPETGSVMTVEYQPATGARRYVPASSQPPPRAQ
jgi:hypothetical protein